MSSTGGGLRLSPNEQKVAMSTDLKGLTITNNSSSDLALGQQDIDDIASQYCPDPYVAVGLSKTDAGWTVTSGPSE